MALTLKHNKDMNELELFQALETANALTTKASVAQALGLVNDVNCFQRILSDGTYKVEVKVNDWSWLPEFKKMSWYATSDIDNDNKEGSMEAEAMMAELDKLIAAWREDNNRKLGIITLTECQQ